MKTLWSEVLPMRIAHLATDEVNRHLAEEMGHSSLLPTAVPSGEQTCTGY